MAKNYLGRGDSVNILAPANVIAGQALLVGSALFGICGADALSGVQVALHTEGEWLVPKATGVAWTVGTLIYWDDAAKNFATTSTSGHTKVGVATEDATSGATSGKVRLNGTF